MKSDPKHIVITGASSGIGRALALHYAAEDITLSFTGRDKDRLEEVADLCEKAGAKVNPCLVDVADERAMQDFLLQVDEKIPVDLLIANAGISAGTGGNPQGETTEQIKQLFDVNFHGVINTITPLLPKMIERKKGQIALMSSLAAYRGWPGAPAYCASKAAVKIYGESLRGTLKSTNVKVNVVCPGFVHSRMSATNDYPMPFIIPAEKAAKIIARGLEKNKGRICFPFPAHAISWLLAAAPDVLAQSLLAFMPSKSAQ